MSACLENESKQRILISGGCVLGRAPECSIFLTGPQVSRRHAMIHSPDGWQHWLVDLGSTNGVRVNGHRIHRAHLLADGDTITVGANKLVYYSGNAPGRSTLNMRCMPGTALADDELMLVNHGVVLLDAAGGPQCFTARAQELLVAYFDDAGDATLPRAVVAWLRKLPARGPASQLLNVVRGGRKLSVRLAERDAHHQVLLLTEDEPLTLKMLTQRLGLSEREGEALHWLVQGKSNPEIGTILGISVRTVDKHLQNSFYKLGVENRTGAIRAVVGMLGSSSA